MSDPFNPPRDWEAAYASAPDIYFFGEEPSQIARTALNYFRAFGGDPEAAVALDLGCGEGRDTVYLAAAGLRVAAYDIAPAGLAKMAALFRKRGLPMGRVQVVAQDVRDFAYPESAYDITLAANVYQFLGPDEAPGHISRLQAATKPGGICAVGVFSSAMLAWGVQIRDCFHATPGELLAYFPAADGWRLLDRTDHWTYVVGADAMAAFTHVIARKQCL